MRFRLVNVPLSGTAKAGWMSRLAKEYKRIIDVLSHGESELGVETLEPIDGNLSHWNAVVRGPDATPYAGHLFQLTVDLQEDYPQSPPKVAFKPGKMPHCNVDFHTGEICLDILTRDHWSPAWDLLHVLQAVIQLLGDPVPESPLNIDLANILKANDRLAYADLINYYLSLP